MIEYHKIAGPFRRATEGADRPGFAEGLVGVPSAGLRDRRGNRIIVKLKHVDLYQETKNV